MKTNKAILLGNALTSLGIALTIASLMGWIPSGISCYAVDVVKMAFGSTTLSDCPGGR
ncbi:MAG: hypothetical protein ACHQX3_00690 [Nitrospirales bacterium]